MTFRWETTGAADVTIGSGTSMRFPQRWDVDPHGTLTVELISTHHRNPNLLLQASDDQGHKVSKLIAVEWRCEQDCFFQPGLERCASAGPIQTWAAEQPFMRGRMLWL